MRARNRLALPYPKPPSLRRRHLSPKPGVTFLAYSLPTASQQANASPESAGTIQPVMSSPPPYNAQPSQSHPPLAEYSYIKLFVVVVSTFAALCFVLVLLTERAVTIGPAVVCLSLQDDLVSAAGGLFDVHTRFRGGWKPLDFVHFFSRFLVPATSSCGLRHT
ncbi:hypothetical protein BDZ89DRAFT_1172069 [Hymenopellis radicata]|nr:hypothetical protein BDZ89DRAFT_1172069 [Hymenopellis radicata]